MRWEYINITKADNMLMSGWKLYIYGNTVNEGKLATEMLGGFIQLMDFTVKIATPSIIKRNINRPIAWASMVIYLNPYSIREFNRVVKIIQYDLRDYKSSGYIKGAKSIDDIIHMRYDLKMPINPLVGVEYNEYHCLYRGEYGDYNIPGNEDLKIY